MAINEKITLRNVPRFNREIDIWEILVNLLNRWYIIAAATVVVGVLAAIYFYTPFFTPNTYSANTTVYVRNVQNGSTTSITTSDLNSSTLLVNDYSELIKSRRVTSRVCEMLGLPNLRGYTISISSVKDTRLIRISVSGPYPESVAYIANAFGSVFADVVSDVMGTDVQNVSVIDEAVIPTAPSGPQRLRNTGVAALAAFAATCLIIALINFIDNTLKTQEDVEEQIGIPVLALFALIEPDKKK